MVAVNSALQSQEITLSILTIILYCNSILQQTFFHCIFDQVNAALVKHKRLLSKTQKNLTDLKLFNGIVSRNQYCK